MGAQLDCVGRLDGKASQGTALLETDHVLFRGSTRVKLLFRDLRSIAADEGVLTLSTEQHTLSLELGKAATKWKEKIENPPSLLQKLGVKPGVSLAAIQVRDSELMKLVRAQPAGDRADLIFLGAEELEDLGRVPEAAGRISASGAVWIVYPKGKKHIREADVLAAGKAAGLTDVKVASFSATHTALKFVIPVANRAAK